MLLMGSCISSSSHKTQTSSKIIQMEINSSSSAPPTPVKQIQQQRQQLPTPGIDTNPNPMINISRVSPFDSVSNYRSRHGSREESFYDTQVWLDSDCEDDFYSMNGDFTPSRGNTPVHPSSIGTQTPRLHKTFSPQVHKALFDGRQPLNSGSLRPRGNSSVRNSFSSIPEASGTLPGGVVIGTTSQDVPIKPRKRLGDLFRESMRERGVSGRGYLGYESDSSHTSPNNLNLTSKSRIENSPLARPPIVVTDSHKLEKNKSTKLSQRCFPKLVHIRKH